MSSIVSSTDPSQGRSAILTAAPDASACDLGGMLVVRGIHVAVMAPDDNAPRLVTALDVVAAAVRDALDTPVGDLAWDAPLVAAGADLSEIATSMLAASSTHAVVLGSSTAIAGVVSTLDVAAALGGCPIGPPRRPGPYRDSGAQPHADPSVADAMHRGVLVCGPELPLASAAASLARERIHCLLVGRVTDARLDAWRLLSDMDVLEAVAAGTLDERAGAVAATEPLTIDEREPLEVAASRMVEHHVTHLVATRAGHPSGVLSTLDVLAATPGIGPRSWPWGRHDLGAASR